MVAKFSRPEHREARTGRRGAAEVHAPAAAAAAAALCLVSGTLWVQICPRRTLGAHNPRSSEPNGTYTCTSIRSQLHRNKLQNLVPQQLRAQDFRAHCACAKARNYDSRGPLASISETPVLSIGYYLACCAWSQRSGWGAQLLNYCCARGLEA